jgi:hypothetical protein
MAINFSAQFIVNEKTSTRVLRLTDTSTGFTLSKGNFIVTFPDGSVVSNTDFSSPQISAPGGNTSISLITDIDNTVLTGTYVINYVAVNTSLNEFTKTEIFDFNWEKPVKAIINDSDVVLPEVQFKDLTAYETSGSFSGVLTRNFFTTTPSTSEVGVITKTSVGDILTPVNASKYYEGIYLVKSDISVAYTHTSKSWLTVAYTDLLQETFDVREAPTQNELVVLMNNYKAQIEEYKSTNPSQYEILNEQYDLVLALYSHIIARYQTGTLDGSKAILDQLLGLLPPTEPYTYKATQMLPFTINFTTSLTGTGTIGTISKFTGTASIGDSIIKEDTNRIGIGKTPTTTLDVNGTIQGTSIVKSGGTSSQFLKADGSIDSGAYLTGVSWGAITGTLSSQEDLKSALDLKAPLASPAFTGTVSGITKSMVGLSNVDNTSDAAKPISTATQTALDLKAPLASPTFTGTVSGITKSMVGLSNVDNTTDAAKPISTATQTALDLKAPLASPTFTGTVNGITKSMVGLSNVDNTSDANKPVSSATQTALNLKYDASNPSGYISGISSGQITTALGFTPENAANKGVNNGYAGLDSTGKVPSTQLPSYVDDVLEAANVAALPATGETGKIYITLDTNKIYRWTGSVYVEISPSVGTVWGGITGTLSNQIDLRDALNAKFNNPTGLASQYIRGDGTLAVLPAGGGGGGGGVSYYLNGSINQGTIGGVTYYEMNKVPIIGTGTDFSRSSNGYIASFLTDANDPALLNIPAGNWNIETYLQASNGGGSPSFYIELYKYDGTTFTLIASNSGTPKLINDGTSIEAYYSALAVPQTTLTLTDRLAIRIYVNASGRTITLHTENGHLCQVVTTFSSGLSALNGLTEQVQYFATGTSGTDFNISSSAATHTFNLPTASATNRGALSSADWITFNGKANLANPVFTDNIYISGTNPRLYFTDTDTNPDYTIFVDSGVFYILNQTVGEARLSIAETGNISAGIGKSMVATSFIKRGGTSSEFLMADGSVTSGAVVNYPGIGIAVSGGGGWLTSIDDNSANWNAAYSARISSLTTTGNSGAATLASNVLNIPNYTIAGLGGQPAFASGTGFVKISGTTISYVNETYYLASNPSGYTTNAGTVTSVSGTGTVSGLTLTGTVTSSGSLTLGGTIALASGDVTTALGFMPVSPSSLSNYLPLTGGSLANTLSSGYVLSVTNNGTAADSNGLYVNIDTASTGTPFKVARGGVSLINVNYLGATVLKSTITAISFIKSSGTSSEFLKADGSVDSNTYVTSGSLGSYLPLSGGTLTGPLGGTSASFSSSVIATGGFEIPNGQFYRARRTSSNLLTDMIGIPSGTNDVRILTTGAFNVVSGGLTPFLGITDAGAATFSSSVSASNYVASGGNFTTVFNSASATTGWVQIAMNNTSGSALFGVEADSGGNLASGTLAYASVLRNYTNTAFHIATNNTVRATITSAGNLGIGTTSPGAKLTLINGTFQIGGTSTFTNNVEIGRVGGDDNLGFAINATERMRITSGGNVLIGTTTDSGFKLDVNGTGIFGGALTAGTWQAYSFSVNNAWLSENTTFDGAFKRRAAGYAIALYSDAGSGFQIRMAGTAAAGTTIAWTQAMAIDGSSFTARFISSVTATGFFESSDKTIKTLIEDNYQTKGIESVTAKLYLKNGVEELGYFAQDVQGILPSAVSKGADGLLNLSYREVHTAKIARLEKEVEELKAQLNSL